MCRGRHRVENRVGKVQARGEVGRRGGAGRGGAGGEPRYKCFPLPSELSCGSGDRSLYRSAINELHLLHREILIKTLLTLFYVQNVYNLRF